MATFGSVEPFDMKSDNWFAYEDRIGLFLEANSVDDDKKVSTFLSLIGPECYNLVKTLCSPEKPSDKTVTELFLIMREHFCPKKIVIAERYRFHNAKQAEGETIAAYVTKLKKLSENCQFGKILSEMLKDRFVCGLKDEATLQRLLTEEDLSFQSAISISSTMEAIAKDSKELHQPSRQQSADGNSNGDAPTNNSQFSKGEGPPQQEQFTEAGGPPQRGQFTKGGGPCTLMGSGAAMDDGPYPLGQIPRGDGLLYPPGQIPSSGSPYQQGQIPSGSGPYPLGQIPSDSGPLQQGQFPRGVGPLHQGQFVKGDPPHQQSQLTFGAAAQFVDGIVNKMLTHRSEQAPRPVSQEGRRPTSAPHQRQFPMEEVHYTHVSAPRPVVHHIRVNPPRPVVHHVHVNSPRPVVHHVHVNSPRTVVHHVKVSAPRQVVHHIKASPPNGNPGQQKPRGNPAQQKPQGNPCQQKPKANPGPQKPKANPGPQKPKANPGQSKPKANPGQQKPKANPGQQKPKATPGQQNKPKGNPGKQKAAHGKK